MKGLGCRFLASGTSVPGFQMTPPREAEPESFDTLFLVPALSDLNQLAKNSSS